MPQVKFVILSQPRTGSTLLCSLLSSAPGVRALCEPINPRTHNHHMKPILGSNCLVPEDFVQNNLLYVLDTLFSGDLPPSDWILSKKRGDVAAGFKIMAHQIQGLKNEDLFWEYLASNNIKVIICFRYNILMQYVSDIITTVTRQPACWNGDVKTTKVEIDITKLEFELKKIVKQKEYLLSNVDKYGLDKRRIKYEDFKNSTESVEKLFYWLVGENKKLSTRLIKQNPDNLIDRVTNYEELVTEVRRLGYERLLEMT